MNKKQEPKQSNKSDDVMLTVLVSKDQRTYLRNKSHSSEGKKSISAIVRALINKAMKKDKPYENQ